jgi:archaellin
MSSNESEVTCRVENKTVFANMYVGINSTILPTDSTTDTMFDAILVDDTAELFIGNTDYDASLDYDEKGFLVFKLDPANAAAEREHVFIEIRPEKGAPLTIEFIIPPQLTVGWHTIGS